MVIETFKTDQYNPEGRTHWVKIPKPLETVLQEDCGTNTIMITWGNDFFVESIIIPCYADIDHYARKLSSVVISSLKQNMFK